MAQYQHIWDNFNYDRENDNVDVLTTPVIGDALVVRFDQEPGYIAQTYIGDNRRKVAFWQNMTGISNGEICAKFGRQDNNPAADVTGWGVIMRASNAATTLNCYAAVRYGTSLRLVKYISGSVSALTSDVDMGSSFWNSPHFIKLSCIGTAIKAKAWAAGSPEPANWQMEATDTSLSIGASALFSFLQPLKMKFGQLKWTTAGESLGPMEFKISGTVKEDKAPNPDIPLVRTVRAVRRANRGQFHNQGQSLSDGTFELYVPTNDEYIIYVLDELVGTYNALIRDRIFPLPF